MSGSIQESGSGLEAHLDVQQLSAGPPESSGGPPESSGGPPRCPVEVVWPFRMSGSGRDTLPDDPEGWEALPEVREAKPEVRECLGHPPGCL